MIENQLFQKHKDREPIEPLCANYTTGQVIYKQTFLLTEAFHPMRELISCNLQWNNGTGQWSTTANTTKRENPHIVSCDECIQYYLYFCKKKKLNLYLKASRFNYFFWKYRSQRNTLNDIMEMLAAKMRSCLRLH